MRRILVLLFVLGQTGLAAAAPAGIDLSYLDRSIRPGDDFFGYANGGWTKGAHIPPDRTYAGVNLELDRQNEARLKSIVAGLLAKPEMSLTAEERKLRDLYAGFADVRAIEARGLAPAGPELAAIARIANPDDVARAMADPALGLDGPFSVYIAPDDKHPGRYAVHFTQSGLGMPDRDYYLKNEKPIAEARAAYLRYLRAMLAFAGARDAGTRADAVYALEAKMARASWAASDRRDAEKTYNPMPLGVLARLAPGFPWASYLAGAGVASSGPRGARLFIVEEKTAFPGLAAIFATTPVAVWRDYLAVRYLHAFAAELPKRVDDADFAFYGKVIGGNAAQLDRATRGVQLLNDKMGEALGRLYVARHFPPEAKAKARALVDNLLKAYAADIRTLSWMTPATRARALAKLAKISAKIGYPDRWRDYSRLAIARGDPVGNVARTNSFEWNRELARLDRPVDRSEWEMSPPTVNAYYDPSLNEIVFPAGILQPPYFDPKADDAANYGEIGATIGHEISHGFDDQGSRYTGEGVLQNWWTASDRKNFDARTAALSRQYDAYEPLPGLHINGALTLGENIADLAGLAIAYRAYHLALEGRPAPVLDGLTGDQRFYLAYAQSWREIWRDGRTRRILLSDPHSPPLFRVDGVVRNSDGWYAAFGVRPGDRYYLAPGDRVRLW